MNNMEGVKMEKDRLFALLQNTLGILQEEMRFNHDKDLIEYFKNEIGITDNELEELGWGNFYV